MSSKSRQSGTAYRSGAGKGSRTPNDGRRLYLAIAGVGVAVVAVLIAGFVLLGGLGSSSAAPAQGETIHQATGGHWTNVTPDRLAQMLQSKDFTLLNVKTPYIGEIVGTDLYIPYDEISSRTTELPKDKTAKILVYCRSGVESAAAAQTLITLGYTNVWNLDGGMNAWQASGRTLVQKNR